VKLTVFISRRRVLVVRLRSCWTLTRWGSCGFGVPLLGSLETPVGRRLKINRPNAARLSRLCACCSWPLAAASDTAKLPVFPKGYVFDPRRAFTKNLKKPISRERYDLCESGVSTGDRVGRRHAHWPIADATPASGQRESLLSLPDGRSPPACKLVQRG